MLARRTTSKNETPPTALFIASVDRATPKVVAISGSAFDPKQPYEAAVCSVIHVGASAVERPDNV